MAMNRIGNANMMTFHLSSGFRLMRRRQVMQVVNDESDSRVFVYFVSFCATDTTAC